VATYRWQVVFVEFIGTHSGGDDMDAETIQMEVFQIEV
jgi:mRNA-degrading endonuclease HigB of HigAB toxin-antitoxin module